MALVQFSQLWGLLALISLPVIVLLFVLRPKRRTQLVSTTRLWKEALRERHRGQGLEKLLGNLSLLLLLLFALVTSLAVAGLVWSLTSQKHTDLVVVLDVSASMKARGALTATRIESAKSEAAHIINQLDQHTRLLLMTSGRDATIRTAFESDQLTLERALNDIAVTDESGNPRQALVTALSLLRHRNQGKVVLITDGAFDDIEGLDSSRIQFINVAGGSDNVAITRFDIRSEIGTSSRHQVLVTVRNYTDEQVVVPLRITLDDRPLLLESLTLKPLLSRTIVLPLQGRIAGAAHARIDIDDAFADDNSAYAVVERDTPLQVLLLGPENIYLDSALAALPAISVTRSNDIPVDFASEVERYDVVIVDSLPVLALPPGRYLLINTTAPDLPVMESGHTNNPIVNGKGSAALLQDIDLSNLNIQRAKTLTPAVESSAVQPLFWSDDTTLAFAFISNKMRAVGLGFDLADSNFPLLASFPLFLGESLDWLHPRTDRNTRTQVAAGEPVNIATPSNINSLNIETPLGDRVTLSRQGDSFQFHQTSQAGFYRYVAGDIEGQFAVNLTNEKESDIRPRARSTFLSDSSSPPVKTGRIDIPLWPYLVMAALALLMIEWILWCWRGANA